MSKETKSNEGICRETSVLSSPQWITVFFAIAIPTSLIFLIIGFYLGYSVKSDVVFGIYALFSGVSADMVLRWRFNRVLVVFSNPHIPFIILWIVLCLYIIAFQPLD